MARKRKQQRASSGAPGVRNAMGGPALNPLGLSQRGGVNYLDPSVALQEIEHPSAKWAGVELPPVKRRRVH